MILKYILLFSLFYLIAFVLSTLSMAFFIKVGKPYKKGKEPKYSFIDDVEDLFEPIFTIFSILVLSCGFQFLYFDVWNSPLQLAGILITYIAISFLFQIYLTRNKKDKIKKIELTKNIYNEDDKWTWGKIAKVMIFKTWMYPWEIGGISLLLVIQKYDLFNRLINLPLYVSCIILIASVVFVFISYEYGAGWNILLFSFLLVGGLMSFSCIQHSIALSILYFGVPTYIMFQFMEDLSYHCCTKEEYERWAK